MKKWEIRNKKLLKNLKIFNLFEYEMRSPYQDSQKKKYYFYVLDSSDWINIFPLTDDNKVVLVEQYRPGTDSITLELPGGMVKADERPLKSAQRELLEETGFISEEWSKLGIVNPNPAILNNKCHTFLANNVEKISEPDNFGSEHTKVKLVDLSDLEDFINGGIITHSLVINAIYWYKMKEKKF
jgi:8-oxo-dGTP pyrophosphatase MutT (NUDIX family)